MAIPIPVQPINLLAFIQNQAVMQQQLIEAQRQLIDAQQQIIELQKQIAAMTPKQVADEDVFWHIASGGVLSEEAATSENVEVVRRFQDWNIRFAQKHLKPYLNPLVYGECLNQMTRGLNTRIVELEHKQKQVGKSNEPVIVLQQRSRPKRSKPKQLELVAMS